MTKRITFDDLARIEPELYRLLAEALDHRQARKSPFCANQVWYGYGGLKQRLCKIVGHERPQKHPLLSSSKAYDIAYERIYQALPDCVDCGCYVPAWW